MNIFEDNGQLWTTSLEIADMLGIKHFILLRDFKRKTAQLQQLDNEYQMVLVEYTDAKGEKRPMYKLNEMMTDLITTGYDMLKRAKIISEFHAMKRYLEETKQVEAYNKWRINDKQKQKDLHETIKDTINNPTKKDFTQANTFINKATTLATIGKILYVSKQTMEQKKKDMLPIRQDILLDYQKGLEVSGTHEGAKKFVKQNGMKGKYKKWI